ncbi:UNVERIFIED_CONTAM: hypothetical protein O8I53_08625 [Campylobacter lari]
MEMYIRVLIAANDLVNQVNGSNPRFAFLPIENKREFVKDIYDSEILEQKENLEFDNVIKKYTAVLLMSLKSSLKNAVDSITIIDSVNASRIKQNVDEFSSNDYDEINE